MTGQDAGRRGEDMSVGERIVFMHQHMHYRGYQHKNCPACRGLVQAIDAAVAEAVKEQHAEIERLHLRLNEKADGMVAKDFETLTRLLKERHCFTGPLDDQGGCRVCHGPMDKHTACFLMTEQGREIERLREQLRAQLRVLPTADDVIRMVAEAVEEERNWWHAQTVKQSEDHEHNVAEARREERERLAQAVDRFPIESTLELAVPVLRRLSDHIRLGTQ